MNGFIKSVLENNENVNSRTYELNKLKRSFPQYFDKEGNFNFDKFKSALDEKNVQYSDEEFSQKESYSLNFVGKKFAQILTGQEAVTVITPDLEHNNKPENKDSENIYIKGDNLEALKHMLNSYEGKIKCIYIDPPYNTGSDDFAYPDNFRYDKKTLIKMGLSEEEAERVENIYGKSTHSAWLTFMMPRLTLARDLLSDDGVIFISIDDNEQANLKALCDEIFGEENFVTIIPRISSFQRSGQEKYMNVSHDYILCYHMSNCLDFNNVTERDINSAKILEDANGHYIEGDTKAILAALSQGYSEGGDYDFEYNGKIFSPIDSHGNRNRWLWTKERMQAAADLGILVETKNSLRMQIYIDKVFEVGTNKLVPKNTNLRFHTADFMKESFDNAKGAKELKQIFNGQEIFRNPKPRCLIEYLCKMCMSQEDTTLDFFSGSATTAHAVMQLNAEDNGNRKFILVNIQEPLKSDSEAYKAGYRTICDIGIDRIKRAAKKIKEETNANIDYGFKIYELNTPSNNMLDKVLSFDETVNKMYPEDFREHFKFNNINGEDTILQTWKVNDGYGFNAIHEEIELDSNIAYKVCKTLYLINPTTDDFIKSLIEKLDNELKDINKIVVFGYSYTLTQLQALDINIKNFNDIKGQDERVKVEVRY